MQKIFVVIIAGFAAVYAVRYIWKRITSSKNACSGGCEQCGIKNCSNRR